MDERERVLRRSSSVNSGGARGGPRLLISSKPQLAVPLVAPLLKPSSVSMAAYSMACCRKPLMNSRSSTAMSFSDAASSSDDDDASSAESESDTADTRPRGPGGGARARKEILERWRHCSVRRRFAGN